MSTPNFRMPFTRKHYTIGIDHELDEFGYDDAISNIQSELKSIKTFKGHEIKDKWIGNDRRVIYGFDVELYDKTYKEWNYATIYITIESGYYAGAMFDIDQSEIESYEVNKSLQTKIDTLYRAIEKVFSVYTFALVRTALFSNGEAIYEPASSNKSVIKALLNGGI